MYVLARFPDHNTATKYNDAVMASMPEMQKFKKKSRNPTLFVAKGLDNQQAGFLEEKSQQFGALEVVVHPEIGSRQPKGTKSLPKATLG